MGALLAIAQQADGIVLSTAQIVSGIGTLGLVIAALFWQLLKAKGETTQAYKDVLPIATSLMDTTKALERLVITLEAGKGEPTR